MRIVACCALGRVGGALGHAWDMLRLWRSHGVDVTVRPSVPLSDEWRGELRKAGCRIAAPGQPLAEIAGLPQGIVVGICDSQFLQLAGELRQLGCRRVWVNCMTWMFPQEGRLYQRSGLLEAYVFQSEFQRNELERGLAAYGYRPELGHLIRSEFELAEWPFEPQPRDPDCEFVVGRLARPDPSKWSRRTWEIYGAIDHPRRRAVVMGADNTIRKWIGQAPAWAEVLPPGAMPAHDFYRRLHCLMPINFALRENWPRIGLEAMACGVPIVAPREGGWCDMITHDENGFLASTPAEFAELGTLLSRDEPLRMRIAAQARRRLETELANPDQLWAGWQRLFASLDG